MRALIAVLLTTCCASAQADWMLGSEKYRCTAEQATGFSYDAEKKTWRPATFMIDAKFHIVKPPKGDLAYIVEGEGIHAVMNCQKDFNPYGWLSCDFLGTFKFNKNNGRFLYSNMMGYVNVLPGSDTDRDEKSAQPVLILGTCTAPDVQQAPRLIDAQQGAPKDGAAAALQPPPRP